MFVYVGMAQGFGQPGERAYRPDHTVRFREHGTEATWRDLPMRNDLRDHSPDGACWGYGGSGPAQLALALLAHATGDDELALRHYQTFKALWVAQQNPDRNWELSQAEILAMVAALEGGQDVPDPA